MNQNLSALVVIVVAYLLGSIPFGYLIVRATAGGDIRQTGSGGTGATNVSRRAGKFAGVFTLVLDAAKGAAAVILAQNFSGTSQASLIVPAAAVSAIIGHLFPVWLNFRGGKGVATAIGIFLVLDPLVVLGAGVVFLGIVWSTRYVSLGSILSAVTVPLLVWLEHYLRTPDKDTRPLLITSVVIAILVFFAHRKNLQRLISGTESKFK